MRYEELTAETLATRRAASAAPGRPTPTPVARARPPRRGQSADHTWRDQVFENHTAYRQLAKDRRAWERVQP